MRAHAAIATGESHTYTYDADGQRVKKVEDGQTTVYIGNLYEKNLTTGVVTTYYYAGSQRIAQRQGGSGSVVSYFIGDNLGSTSVTLNDTGGEVGRQKYYPFGAPRVQSGTLKTDYRFTGQRSEEANFGSLYDYGARFYSPILGRFISPDTVIPAPGNPQSLNRYAYTANNPLRYTDPTGHWLESALDIASIIYDIHDIATNGLSVTSGLSLAADVVSLALPVMTGGGLLVRSVAHIDDAAKALSHADDILKVASHTDAATAAGLTDEAAKLSNFAEEAVQELFHATSPEAVEPIMTGGFKTNIPDPSKAFKNNRFGSGVYLSDSPTTALAERSTGVVLGVQADLGRNLNVTNRGIITPDVGQSIARGARKHGFDSITFASSKRVGGVNHVVFNPRRAKAIRVVAQ